VVSTGLGKGIGPRHSFSLEEGPTLNHAKPEAQGWFHHILVHALQYHAGWIAYATRSRWRGHVSRLRQRRLRHLRGISFPAEGYVERLTLRRTGSRARKPSSSHPSSAPPAVRCRRPPASLARTAAIRTSAVAQGIRTPYRHLPRHYPRVQIRSRRDHRGSTRNGVVKSVVDVEMMIHRMAISVMEVHLSYFRLWAVERTRACANCCRYRRYRAALLGKHASRSLGRTLVDMEVAEGLAAVAGYADGQYAKKARHQNLI